MYSSGLETRVQELLIHIYVVSCTLSVEFEATYNLANSFHSLSGLGREDQIPRFSIRTTPRTDSAISP
jgi:hypothetical protein